MRVSTNVHVCVCICTQVGVHASRHIVRVLRVHIRTHIPVCTYRHIYIYIYERDREKTRESRPCSSGVDIV